jgi:hypothetical protein
MSSKDESITTLASVTHFDRWVGWREEMVAKRRTKVPYNPRSGGRAKSDNPATWATHDEAQKWARTQRDAGIGVMLGPINDTVGALCGIDLDTCRDKATGKIDPWAQEIIDRFSSYTEISPSGTGAHVLFRLAAFEMSAVDALFDGKFGRAFKLPSGSEHPPAIEVYRGSRYFAVTWEAIGSEDELRRIPVTDLEWLLREAGPKFAGERKPTDGGPKDDSRSAKAYRAGAALKAGGATYEEMRDALLAHTDVEIAEWARTKGMADGERELRRIFGKAWKQGSIVNVAGVEKRLVTLEELNDRYALLEARGKPSVYVSRIDCMPIKEDDLRRRLAGEVVLTGKKNEKPSYESAYKFWTGHARRHIYRRIAFTSEETPPDTLNLFRGLGVAPRKGNCTLILAHIHEVVCSSNTIASDRMLDLMAWQAQNVGKPSRVIVVIKSKGHQAGKGLLLHEVMLKIYGDAGFIPSSIDQVLGRFNDAIVGCVYIFLDEVMFSGDRRAADALKSLATATEYGIETKGLPIIKCPVGVNFWMATNHDVAAFIEEHDARYWVLNVSEHRIGDTNYFGEVLREIENGGREAFAHILLNRDVSGFVPLRDTPKNNDAKREMIRRSINPFDARKWLEDCCLTLQIIGAIETNDWMPGQPAKWRKWIPGETIAFYVLANAYTAWQRDVKSPVSPQPTPKGSLGELLNNAGFGRNHNRAGSDRTLPHPEDCLKNLFKPPSEEGPDSVLH